MDLDQEGKITDTVVGMRFIDTSLRDLIERMKSDQNVRTKAPLAIVAVENIFDGEIRDITPEQIKDLELIAALLKGSPR